MAVRKVELRLSDPGYEDVAAHLDALSAKLDKLKAKFDELSKKLVTPKIDVQGLTEADVQLDKLNAKLDELSHKRVTAHVGVNVDSHALRRDAGSLLKDIGGGGGGIARDLGGAAGAGGGGAASGILSSLGGANNQYTGGLIAALVAWAAGLVPSVVPFALGLGVSGGAAGGALALGSRANQKIIQLQQQLQTGKGSAKANAPILAQIAAIRRRNAPELQAFGTLRSAGHQALDVFNEALTSTSQGFSGGPGGHPGTSFMTGLLDVLKQIGPFLEKIGPSLGKLLQASAPFLQAFFNILAKSVKTILPAFTQSLKAITPYIPELSKGFVMIAQGLAGFLKNLGPGMGASSGIFLGSMRMIAAIIRGTGAAVTGFSILFRDVFHGISMIVDNAPQGFRQMAHAIASIFDGIRHGIASAWDAVFQNTIGELGRLATSALTDIRNLITNIVNWFKRLPGDVLNALRGLGHSLYAFAHAALSEMWDGFKAVWGSIWNWVKNNILSLPSKIMHALHMSPPHPGSAFYDLGANFMHHMEAGIKSRLGSIGGAISGAVGSGIGATSGGIQNTALQIAKSIGWGNQWGAINAIAMRESGWSMTARNPSSGAYGIAQFINGPGEYYQWGGNPNTAVGQITAFYNYIKSTYGTPAGAWAHELSHGWYDRGGILKQGLTLALNTSGHDEYVTTGPPGGGTIINIYQMDDTYSDAQALRTIKKLRTYRTRHGHVPLNLG